MTERRINRTKLKKLLLEEIWKEETEMEPYEKKYDLIMSAEVRDKVNRLRILDEDIRVVIDNAEATGRRTFDPETGHYRAYKEIRVYNVLGGIRAGRRRI